MKVGGCERTVVMGLSGLEFNIAELARCLPTGSWESWESWESGSIKHLEMSLPTGQDKKTLSAILIWMCCVWIADMRSAHDTVGKTEGNVQEDPERFDVQWSIVVMPADIKACAM